MLHPDLLIPFLVTVIIFASVPGPAMIYAAARTLAGGRTAGLTAALGIHLGGYVHVIVAASGLALIAQGTPLLLAGLKLLGAAYLVWLGLNLVRVQPTAEDVGSTASSSSTRRVFRESITVQILNPAAAIFYVAFLPQFVDASSHLPVWAQFVLLGTMVNLIFSTTKVMTVLMAEAMLLWLRQSGQNQSHVHRAAGSLLVGMAVYLAMSAKVP